MEQPVISHKYLSTFRDIKKISNDVLFEKYIIRNDSGTDKLKFLEDTDQETLIRRLNGGLPIPGLMYTFIYKPSIEEINIIITGKKIEKYTDHVPIVFCLDVKKDSFTGINLTVLPPSERLKFLQFFYEAYISFFKDMERDTQNDIVSINKVFLNNVASNKGQDVINLLGKRAGSMFNYGYRKYLFPKIDNFRMIEFEEWKYIPFYNSDNEIKMMNLNKVHYMYWKQKK